MKKKLSHQETREIALEIMNKIREKGHLTDSNDHYFCVQDAIHDQLNKSLGLGYYEDEEPTQIFISSNSEPTKMDLMVEKAKDFLCNDSNIDVLIEKLIALEDKSEMLCYALDELDVSQDFENAFTVQSFLEHITPIED